MNRRLIVLLALFASISSAAAQNAAYQQDPKWKPPADAASKSNPLHDRPDTAAGGQKLYRRHCAECHGPAGEGLKKAADFRLPAVQQQTDGTLFWKITNGNPDRGMPSFSRLPEMQRWQIVLYLRTLSLPPETKQPSN